MDPAAANSMPQEEIARVAKGPPVAISSALFLEQEAIVCLRALCIALHASEHAICWTIWC
jgi:hypothetical protein